jgi:hypothetical protein
VLRMIVETLANSVKMLAEASNKELKWKKSLEENILENVCLPGPDRKDKREKRQETLQMHGEEEKSRKRRKNEPEELKEEEDDEDSGAGEFYRVGTLLPECFFTNFSFLHVCYDPDTLEAALPHPPLWKIRGS